MKKIIYILTAILAVFFTQIAFADSSNNFLVLSDIHLIKTSAHKMEISPSAFNKANDLDLPTFVALLDTLEKNIGTTVQKPQAIFLLGDIVGHGETQDNALQDEKEVFSRINQFSKDIGNVPVFYVFGNNDSLITDYGPFLNKDSQSAYTAAQSTGWIDGFLSTGTQCGKNIFPCLATEDKTNGYYSAYLQPKLRLLILNTVLFSPKRSGVTEQDAQNELQWLSDQLKDAEQNQDTVLIGMHIPPGKNVFDDSSFYVDSDYAPFVNLITAHQKIIMGLLSSHTHMEELKVFKDKTDKRIGAVIYTTALSTSHGNNPSVKTFYYTQQNNEWLLANYDTFHFADDSTNTLSLSKLYDFNSYYCDSLHTNNIMDCLSNFSANKMLKYFSAGNKNYSGTLQYPDDVFIKM